MGSAQRTVAHMKQVRIPSFLQEAFGTSQPLGSILAVLAFAALATTSIMLARPPLDPALPGWRNALAWVVIFDIAAGCLANFTFGTNEYYAARPRARWVFISIHIHLFVVAWALQADMRVAMGVWAYTIAGATLVNLLFRHPQQLFVAALWVMTGWILLTTIISPGALLPVYALFLMKVAFAFAVDHFAGTKDQSRPQTSRGNGHRDSVIANTM